MATIVQTLYPSATKLLHEEGLASRILTADNAEYDVRIDSYWSNGAKLKPACIVLPKTAQEVATVVKSLVAANQEFAIRSGGHTNWPGSNNINDGVTIDLSSLNTTTIASDLETASIGPGARWKDVYAELHKHQRVVAGGREGNVGVAGLILGGGNTFFTGRYGFACDNVVAFEVVLADGRIITADSQSHADLFRALKGGSNNFGIVTNFTMKTIKCDRVWGGMNIYSKQTIPLAIDAFCAFTENIRQDVDSNLITMFTYLPDFKDIVVAAFFAQVGGISSARAYDKWRAIPEILTMNKATSISEMAFEYNTPKNHYSIWFTACFKNDSRIIAKASELHDAVVEELKEVAPDGDFITQCILQPLPTLYAEQSARAGGNIMGVEHHPHDGLLLLAVAMMKTPEQEAFAFPKVKKWIHDLKDYASSIDGGNLDWIYLNYADRSQNPLSSYGAKNVGMMKSVAAEYDPNGVFQHLCPGGFKISQVAI